MHCASPVVFYSLQCSSIKVTVYYIIAYTVSIVILCKWSQCSAALSTNDWPAIAWALTVPSNVGCCGSICLIHQLRRCTAFKRTVVTIQHCSITPNFFHIYHLQCMIVYIFITQFSMRLNLPYLSDDGQAAPPTRSISITKERERPISRNRLRSNFHKIYGKDILKKLRMSNNKKGCKCINVHIKYASSSPSCLLSVGG